MSRKVFWILWVSITVLSLLAFTLGARTFSAPVMMPGLYALLCNLLVLWAYVKGYVYKPTMMLLLTGALVIAVVNVFIDTSETVSYFLQAPLYVAVAMAILSLTCVAGARLESRLTTFFGILTSGAISSSVVIAVSVINASDITAALDAGVSTLDINYHIVLQVATVMFLSIIAFVINACYMARHDHMIANRYTFVYPRGDEDE